MNKTDELKQYPVVEEIEREQLQYCGNHSCMNADSYLKKSTNKGRRKARNTAIPSQRGKTTSKYRQGGDEEHRGDQKNDTAEK